MNKGTLAMKKLKQNLIDKWNKSPKLCKECGSPISYEARRNIFCTKVCSATFGNRKRTESGWKHSSSTIKKLKQSGKIYGKLSYTRMIKEKINIICKLCGKHFKVYPHAENRKYCSVICSSSDPNRYKNCGGYREGSGHSKSGYYKGIYCQSTYELCWVIYALDNGIKFDRFKDMLTDGVTKYVPDFLLDDKKTIIELKGYEKEDSVNRKTKLAESLGYTVIVLRKNDLTDIFKYVKETYGTNQFYELYEK
jgi:hypothetical protein